MIDGQDNSCDGSLSADELDADGDGYISGVIDVNGWDGINSVLEGDCDDLDLNTYPGAAYNDSSTACLADIDGDGFGELNTVCYELNLLDSDANGWGAHTVNLVVDGNSIAAYSNSGTASQIESFCTSGTNIALNIVFDPTTVSEVGVELYDGQGVVLGNGFGVESSQQGVSSFSWINSSYLSGSTFFTDQNVGDYGTDCNDLDANIYPTAQEIAGDNLDSNCDGAEMMGYDCQGDLIDSAYYLTCGDDFESWSGASISCQNMGYGGLAIVDSQSQNQGLSTLMGNVNPIDVFWIGLTDATFESDFVWRDGSTPGYFNWDTSQPDDQGVFGLTPANCVTSDASNLWTDEDCATLRPFACSVVP